MEPSNNYQTTVDTDTFHPRDPGPDDVARVRAGERIEPSRKKLPALTRPTNDIPRSDRWPPGARVSPRRTPTPAITSLNSTSTAEGPSRWMRWAPSSVRLCPHLSRPRPKPRSAGFGGHLFLPARVPHSSVSRPRSIARSERRRYPLPHHELVQDDGPRARGDAAEDSQAE